MAMLQTVLGTVNPKDMGITNYHEHVYVKLPPWAELIPGWEDHRIDNVQKNIEELRTWHLAGGVTIVDSTAIDFGHDAHKLLEIAENVPGVHIIATTGFNKSAYCERWVFEWSIDRLIEHVTTHITNGIDGTEVKAGVVKGGSMYMRMQEIDEKLLRIAARVHLKTGAPISTHTEAGTLLMEQVDIFKEEGVDLSRVAIGHADRNPDADLHISLCKRGVYLGYDCPGKIKYGPDSWRIDLIKKVVGAGYGNHILFGNDLGRVSYLKSYGGGPGLDFILTKFVPRLLDEGISDESINDILVENPKRFFPF